MQRKRTDEGGKDQRFPGGREGSFCLRLLRRGPATADATIPTKASKEDVDLEIGIHCYGMQGTSRLARFSK